MKFTNIKISSFQCFKKRSSLCVIFLCIRYKIKVAGKKKQSKKNSKFECEFCSRVLQTRSGYSRHLMHHTGKTPYVCGVCNKGFIDRNHLKGHMVKHGLSKKIECKDCKKTFTMDTSLRRHKRKCKGLLHKAFKYQPEETHLCSLCGMSFTRKDSLRDHIAGAHDKKKTFVCYYCGKGFCWRSSHSKHIRSLHMKELKADRDANSSKSPIKIRRSYHEEPSLEEPVNMNVQGPQDKEEMKTLISPDLIFNTNEEMQDKPVITTENLEYSIFNTDTEITDNSELNADILENALQAGYVGIPCRLSLTADESSVITDI